MFSSLWCIGEEVDREDGHVSAEEGEREERPEVRGAVLRGTNKSYSQGEGAPELSLAKQTTENRKKAIGSPPFAGHHSFLRSSI